MVFSLYADGSILTEVAILGNYFPKRYCSYLANNFPCTLTHLLLALGERLLLLVDIPNRQNLFSRVCCGSGRGGEGFAERVINAKNQPEGARRPFHLDGQLPRVLKGGPELGLGQARLV